MYPKQTVRAAGMQFAIPNEVPGGMPKLSIKCSKKKTRKQTVRAAGSQLATQTDQGYGGGEAMGKNTVLKGIPQISA